MVYHFLGRIHCHRDGEFSNTGTGVVDRILRFQRSRGRGRNFQREYKLRANRETTVGHTEVVFNDGITIFDHETTQFDRRISFAIFTYRRLPFRTTGVNVNDLTLVVRERCFDLHAVIQPLIRLGWHVDFRREDHPVNLGFRLDSLEVRLTGEFNTRDESVCSDAIRRLTIHHKVVNTKEGITIQVLINKGVTVNLLHHNKGRCGISYVLNVIVQFLGLDIVIEGCFTQRKYHVETVGEFTINRIVVERFRCPGAVRRTLY